MKMQSTGDGLWKAVLFYCLLAMALVGCLVALASRQAARAQGVSDSLAGQLAGQWQMTAATIRSRTLSGRYEDVPTVFVLNVRTGITYQFLSTCAGTGAENGCFSQVPYSLDYKGLGGYYVGPDPMGSGREQ